MSGHLTVIEPRSGWVPVQWRELWQYRELLGFLVWRDVKVRYKQTVLGAAWAILQPVMTMLIFSILFGRLAGMPSDGIPYPLFVFAGLLPWTFFANAVGASANSLIGNTHLISKVYFPRLIIPLSSVGAGLVDLLIAMGVMFVMIGVYRIGFTWGLLALPALIVLTTLTALGLGTALSALTVAYRDFRYLIPFMMQLWMFLSPVIYPVSLIPDRWRWLLYVNPMAGVIEGYRSVLLRRDLNWDAIGTSFLIAALLFLAGVAYFRRVERRFADII